ncbi:MFS transporter [Catenulispora subtropica]|uniref:DHA2 family efflux MFS transporter permease subunit n=1 Tax=Catenulispora subtropica TaxID=450798 RepID=A0ABP5BN77_9ACTN
MQAAGTPTTASRLPIIVGLAIAFTITVLDPLIFNLNMPRVIRDLQVPPQAIGLLSGAATLVMASAVLAAGNLGDTVGLKRLLMLGLGVVTVVDLLSAVSPGYGFLLAMRFLDGLGMAPMLGVPLALLNVSVPPEKRPAAIGLLMAFVVFLSGTVPAVTGWAVAAGSWRYLFLITPLLSLVSLGLTARYAEESPLQKGRRVDVVGVVLIGVALLGLVIGLAAAQNGVLRFVTWVPLLISAVASVVYVRHSHRAAEPALDLTLLRRGPFSVALAATLTLNFLMAGLGIVLGQFGGVVLSLSPEAIGLLYLPGTLLVAGGVTLAGRLVKKHTPRPVMITGLLILAAGGLLLAATAGPAMAVWLLVMATWLSNLGSMVTSTAVSETVLSQAPPGRSGTVASVQMAFAVTGAAFGPTVYLLLFNAFFRRHWQADAKSRGMSVAEATQTVDAVRSGMEQNPGGTGYDPNLLRQASGLDLGLDFTDGLRLTMLIVSMLPLGVALVAYFRMPRHKEPQE